MCISNCQDKTYQAFDLYMKVSMLVEARKNHKSIVDVSRYTGMEVEHKHDTGSTIAHNYDGHIHPNLIESFSKGIDRDPVLRNIKKKAFEE